MLNDSTSSTNYLSQASYVITNPSYGEAQETLVSWGVSKGGNLHPNLYFSYIKSKFNLIQAHKLDSKLKALEDAFNEAVENGQEVLAEKFLQQLDIQAKEAALSVKGLKYWIDREDLMKHKNNIRGGHISNTEYKQYTRVIPKRVVKEKDKYAGLFDYLEIWHYYSDEQKDVKKMSSEEKSKMKDPVLFGMIKGSNRMYFIADWEDEYCDLTFSEMTRVLGNRKYKVDVKPVFKEV
jgi:hypothetical protein